MIETGKLLQQRYRIDKQIGQGGMGAVYVATDERFGSTVAIKETLCMDDNYRKAIEREARLLNSLKHIALPRVTDHFLEENGQFLVMEYISGEDLHCILETSEQPFPVEQVLTWADQLLDALDFLHNQVNPVIHRDIKPQNLKVTPKGQIVLLDFGLAKGNPTDAGHQTAAKSIFGYSRNYASLEQIQGTGTDPRSDLYSLAATLYHLLTNRPPEDALTRAMAVLGHQPDPLIPASLIVSDVPAGVAAVLQKALDLNAPARPASAAEMREMLRNHEDYAGMIRSSVRVTSATPADIHSQHTRLMPGSTHAAARATDLRTEVMPPPLSQVTSVKPLAAATASGSNRRRFGVLGLAAAVLVLLGTAIGGMYLVKPEMFRHEAAPAAEREPAAAVPVVEEPNEEVVEAEANVDPDVTDDDEAVAPATGTDRTSSATATAKGTGPKPDRTEKGATQQAEAHADPGKIVVDGETVYLGNTKIHPDGRIETPDGTVVGGKNYSPWNPVRPGQFKPQPMPPPDLRHLTPEQRARVLRAIRRARIAVQPAPSPSPKE